MSSIQHVRKKGLMILRNITTNAQTLVEIPTFYILIAIFNQLWSMNMNIHTWWHRQMMFSLPNSDILKKLLYGLYSKAKRQWEISNNWHTFFFKFSQLLCPFNLQPSEFCTCNWQKFRIQSFTKHKFIIYFTVLYIIPVLIFKLIFTGLCYRRELYIHSLIYILIYIFYIFWYTRKIHM